MKKPNLDQYFLTEKCPYSGKRRLKIKNFKTIGFLLVAILLVSVLFFGGQAEKRESSNTIAVTALETTKERSSQSATDGSIEMGRSSINGRPGQFAGGVSGGIAIGGSARSNRQYTASQLVRSSENSLGGSALPMGTTVPALLVNTLLSSDSAQPVIAQITDAVFWKNSLFIPDGTKAIGGASFDDAAKRLQIRFHTLVYPGGDQHPISALALLSDGSSGIPGDFHSGEAAKQTGRFLGNFVGGVADGMKDRQAGSFGTTIEPGSVKNGILNGLALTALDQSKRFSDDIQKVKPFLEVSGGTQFLLYLEKEYAP